MGKEPHMRRVMSILVVMMVFAGLVFAGEGHELLEKIMKDYHKGKTSLVQKAVKGEASKQEIARLSEAYHQMAKMKPPVGEQADWDKRVAALIAATDELAAGKPGAGGALKEAANCKACHTAHKPD
jgi:cytochrome c5